MSSVSIKDIAQAAGVSHSTVSRALRDSPLISEDTRQRIQKLAQAMGYSPDTIARSLRTGKTQTLGMVVTSIADPFVAAMVQVIDTHASKRGYTLLLATSTSEPAREMEAVRMLREKRVDGVVVTSSRVGSLYASMLEELAIPIVLINNHTEEDARYTYSVTIDNVHGGRMATRHLLAQGHTHIAYVSGSEHYSDDAGRMEGYRQALQEAGIVPQDAWVISGRGQTHDGARAAEELAAMDPRPTAAFCYNDATAIGLVSRAMQMGIRVPDDLAIVGFDDIPLSALTCPALTTVAQPIAKMGAFAVEMVLALIEDARDTQVQDQVLEGTLVRRAST